MPNQEKLMESTYKMHPTDWLQTSKFIAQLHSTTDGVARMDVHHKCRQARSNTNPTGFPPCRTLSTFKWPQNIIDTRESKYRTVQYGTCSLAHGRTRWKICCFQPSPAWLQRIAWSKSQAKCRWQRERHLHELKSKKYNSGFDYIISNSIFYPLQTNKWGRQAIYPKARIQQMHFHAD